MAQGIITPQMAGGGGQPVFVTVMPDLHTISILAAILAAGNPSTDLTNVERAERLFFLVKHRERVGLRAMVETQAQNDVQVQTGRAQ